MNHKIRSNLKKELLFIECNLNKEFPNYQSMFRKKSLRKLLSRTFKKHRHHYSKKHLWPLKGAPGCFYDDDEQIIYKLTRVETNDE